MTKNKIYQRKAIEIIKESIKSVVYIDEKAWNPFEEKYNKSVNEHDISKKLYKNLKEQGINLNIHKFTSGEQDLSIIDSKKKYLFRDIDLVLLDWDLDENDELNEFSLRLLDDVIKQPHIHFCSIYSSSPDFDSIIQKIIAYFSGYSEEDFDNIRESFEYSDEVIEILRKIDITSEPKGKIVGDIIRIDPDIFKDVCSITQIDDKLKTLLPMALSLREDLAKPKSSLTYPFEIISKEDSQYSLIINNTVVSILGKEQNKPKSLISNFAKLIASERDKSFFKLLGLDMQNQFSKHGSFINPDILNISFNTFMHHRKMMNKSGDKPTFEDFIKELFIENSKLQLQDIQLEILKDDFLSNFRVIKNKLTDNEFALMNSFYNGGKLLQNKKLRFGDIFVDDKNCYYLCITALCDCLHPENIQNKFFFVKHTKLLNTKDAIKLGDTSYISYLDEKTCIKWSGTEEFIKPRQFYIDTSEIKESVLKIQDITSSGLTNINLNYKFSLKQNYAQRIANQAFSHPVRVGVDFVKKS